MKKAWFIVGGTRHGIVKTFRFEPVETDANTEGDATYFDHVRCTLCDHVLRANQTGWMIKHHEKHREEIEKILGGPSLQEYTDKSRA